MRSRYGSAAFSVLNDERFVEMAQKAHDELGGDAVLALGLLHPGSEAVDGDGEWQAAVGMELGIEEHLGVPAAIGVEPGEIGEREILEILLGLEDVGSLVADVEKVLEVGEGVGLADFIHRLERHRDLVAAAELEHLLGLERALDVEVEFGLGQAADEGGKIRYVHDSRTGIACWASPAL